MLSNIDGSRSVTRHANEGNLQEYANQSREAERFSDVRIKTGNISFPAHRLVLSCYSQFFEKLFLSPMREQNQGTVELNELDGEAVKTLLDFMYTRVIIIDYNNVFDILATAHFLQVNEVCEFCFEYLMKAINMNNWYTIFSTCHFYENDLLLKQLYQFFCQNFNTITQSASFKELQVDKLTSIVQNINRTTITEQAIYEVIISWIRHDEEDRASELQQLLLLMNLRMLPREFLKDVVALEPLVTKSSESLNTVMVAITQQIKDSRLRESGSRLICAGGVKAPSKIVEVYDLLGISNTVYPDLPHQLFYSKTLVLNKSVFNIGGSLGLNFPVATNKVHRMKENEPKWEEIASMNEKRSYTAAAVFEECIVVAGGKSSGKTRMRSSEVYNPVLNQWTAISNMNDARSEAELVTCDGSLYILGGYDGQRILSSVERLNRLEDSEWELIESMTFPRRMFAAVSYNREIYVIGGGYLDSTNSIIRLKLVEKFNPIEKKWTSVSDMKVERRGHAACLLNGKIYVVGGDGTDGKTVKLIECYDSSTDKWTDVGEVEEDFFGHSLIAL